MSKEIETSKATIKISKEDEENIVKGLATLIDLYADSLKDICDNAKIHGTILGCELVGIDDHIDTLKSINNTLDYFRGN